MPRFCAWVTGFVLLAVAPAAARPPVPPGIGRPLDLARCDMPFVNWAEFSPDGGTLVVSGGKMIGREEERVVTFWDAATGRLRWSDRANAVEGAGAAFSPDGKRIAFWSPATGDVILRDAAGGREVRRLTHPRVSTFAFAPGGKDLFTSHLHYDGRTTTGDVRVWDVGSGRLLFEPTWADGESFREAWFTPDGRLLFETSRQRLRCWDRATRAERPPVRLDRDDLGTLALSRDGATLLRVTVGPPSTLDVATGKKLRTFGRADGDYGFAAFTPDGASVVACDDARVSVWGTATGAERATFTVAAARKGGVHANPCGDDRHLEVVWTVFDANDIALRLDRAVYTLDGRFVRACPGVRSFAFDPTGRTVVVLTETPRAAGPPVFGVTIHDAAAWLADGPRGD